MTREENIRAILECCFAGYKDELIDNACERIYELEQEPTSEMVHVKTLRQVMWGRDIAIEQLHELGYELGQKIEPCDDAISREDALMCLTGMFKLNKNYNPEELIALFSKRIKALPSVTQKSGKWIRYKDNCLYNQCSYCGASHCREDNFCPNCGAKMESEDKG